MATIPVMEPKVEDADRVASTGSARDDHETRHPRRSPTGLLSTQAVAKIIGTAKDFGLCG